MAHTVHDHGSEPCATCEVGPFERNNFFTGKLLLERDFVDEQDYFIDKNLLHNKRLHGWGVVCGLKVKQHQNASCRDRFVCIEPGLALDCCGHEIVVREEECFDLLALPAMQEALKNTDVEKFFEIQVCLRFKECGTEPIPVLYDECGCDETRCLPNRILESFELDVCVDPPATADTFNGPVLIRDTDIGIANATKVRFNKADGNLYVLAGTTVFKFDPVSKTTLATKDLTTNVFTLDISPSGSHIYAVRQNAANPHKLAVLKASDLSIESENDVAGSAGQRIAAAVSEAADERYSVLLSAAGKLLVYKNDLETAAPSAPASNAVPANQEKLALSQDGKTAYLATQASKDIQQFDLDAATLGTAISVVPAGTMPGAVLAASHSGKQYLVVGDASASSVFVIGVSPVKLFGPFTLDGPAVDLAGSGWVYALESLGGQTRIQAISVARAVANQPMVVGPSSGFGGTATDIEVSPGAVYVAYGTGIANSPGGVAVFEIKDERCPDIFWDSLDGCNDCEVPNCVVLATIHGWRPGFAFLDQTDPATDPSTDKTNKIARIDNRAGRRLLPSTTTLYEVLKCLLEQGGIEGPTGPQGPPGVGQPGAQGPPGEGLEKGLVQIRAVSWDHAKPVLVSDLRNVIFKSATGGQTREFGLIIAFTGEIQTDSASDPLHVFEVTAPLFPVIGPTLENGYLCRCPIRGQVFPVDVTFAAGKIKSATVNPGAATTKGIAFVFDQVFVKNVLNEVPLSDLWIRLHGDFVMDTGDPPRAIDAEFVRAEFPTGDRPKGSDFGIQGGLFESWFEPKRSD